LFARANLLALALENEWGVEARLSDLPATPEWSVNGTTAENGKRFRFKSDKLGDYSLGYASSGNFPLSSALAVSAAFPGGFGPLKFDAHLFQWERRPWGAPVGQEEPVDIGYKYLHLYDGGIYDNLGLEPFFDTGRGESKLTEEIIVVSDAGAPLANGFSMGALNPFRLKRVVDIMSDQSRSLRVRAFAHYIQQAHGRGAYMYINTPVSGTAVCDSAEFASNFPTTLRKLQIHEFDRILEHGYRVACQVEALYGIIGQPSGGGE
jgi:NTE family protein